MVKKSFFIVLSVFFLSLTSALFLFAGEFTASVSNTEVSLSESFSLYLALKDTPPKEAPALSALKRHFLIHSEQHSSSTTVLNGKVSSSITWKISLTPKVEGSLEIPSIIIDTEEGFFSTQPIALHVVKAPTSKSTGDSTAPKLITKVSNLSPYKNEPFIYTASLTSKLPLYNVQTQKIQVEDAIVELLGEPKLEEKILEGVFVNVVEFTYLITPLKAGSLTILPMAIQGATPEKRKTQSHSLFNDDFDPFAMMQGFDRLKPFALMTEEIQLDIQPVIAEVSPWLPAKALSLEETWSEDQTFRVGEPFSYGFLIKAEGVKVSQLPHLEDVYAQNSGFKVYADKPEEQEKVILGTIHSSRKEQYTLIPQQAGTLKIPEISISWWDSIQKEKRVSSIPSRSVQILPALVTTTVTSEETVSAPPVTSITELSSSQESPSFLLYGIIGALTVFLTAALLWGFSLQRKLIGLRGGSFKKSVNQQEAKPKKPVLPLVTKPQKEKKEKLPDLNPT